VTLPLLAAALAVVCTVGAAADGLPAPVRETFNCSTDGSRWPYLIQPAPKDPPAAVLIYLHGHYSDEYQGMTEGAYNDAFGKLRRECLRRNWAYVTAWYGGNSWMGPLGEAGVADLIALLKTRWPGVPVYLCGGSMGGSSTLVYACRRPQDLSGAIALCPAGDIQSYYEFASHSKEGALPNIAAAIRAHYTEDGHDLPTELRNRSALLNAERLTMPLYLSHGAKDPVIPVSATQALAARLKDLGRRVKYVELPNGGHDDPVLQVDWQAALDFVSARK
jgi:pimeloyl-ACP methyl ester carboxylesterase